MRLFDIHIGRQKPEAGKHATAVAVNGKYSPVERIQKYASRNFRPNARKRTEEVLGVLVVHLVQRRERYSAEACRYAVQHSADPVHLDPRHSTAVDGLHDLPFRHFTQTRPGSGNESA